MPNLPYIPPMSPQTSVQAASTGASMGNLAADNRLRAAQMAQQAMQFSQELALRRMAQEAEQAQGAERMEIAREQIASEQAFKAQQAAENFQNRLDVARIANAGKLAIQQDKEDSAIRILRKKQDLKLELNEAARQQTLKQLEGAEGADVNLVLDPQRRTAAEKSLLGMKVREAGLERALEQAKSSPDFIEGDPEIGKMQRALTAATAQREFLERSLGRVKKAASRGPSLDAAVQKMNQASASPGGQVLFRYDKRAQRFD